MRPIADIADDCEKYMKPHELFSWEEFWINIAKNGGTPAHKTFAYSKWVEERCRLIRDINKEYTRRKSPSRMICPGSSRGVYRVSEEDVAEITADIRVRKIVNCFEKSHKEMGLLSVCNKISISDRKMLKRLSGMVELQQNTMIGTMAKMKSLPLETKKRLLKKLGFEK